MAFGCASRSTQEQNLQFVIKGEMAYIEQRFQECYRLQFEKDPTIRGQMRIKFSVAKDGKPYDYVEMSRALTGTEPAKKQLTGCVKDVLLNSQFQSMTNLDEDYFDIQYPIKFKPSE